MCCCAVACRQTLPACQRRAASSLQPKPRLPTQRTLSAGNAPCLPQLAGSVLFRPSADKESFCRAGNAPGAPQASGTAPWKRFPLRTLQGQGEARELACGCAQGRAMQGRAAGAGTASSKSAFFAKAAASWHRINQSRLQKEGKSGAHSSSKNSSRANSSKMGPSAGAHSTKSQHSSLLRGAGGRGGVPGCELRLGGAPMRKGPAPT